MIWNSNSWSKSSEEGRRGVGGVSGITGGGRGGVLLVMAFQIDHFGSLEEYTSTC